MSVRDTKEFLGKMKKPDGGISPSGASAKATERLVQELKQIAKSDPKKSGFSVQPKGDNLYTWEIRFFDFDPKEPLGQDLAKTKEKSILLLCTFPKSFPFAPPFIRVIRPRFAYRTGHVTIGGSICTEMLTNKGWSPVNSIEAVLVSIRTNLTTGGARLDFHNKSDYDESEAKAAFDRMVREHGW